MKTFLPILTCLLAASACTQNAGTRTADGDDSSSAPITTFSGGSGGGQPFIGKDSANRMISSYLTSVGAANNDTNLRSLVIDANALRTYLTSTDEGKSISRMKIMFAHTQPYINGGGYGRNCGYRSGALTVVLAGIDGNGNYVFFPTNQVLDFAAPCPTSCPTVGTSSGDIFPQ